ncbi:TIGR02391 family protein [Cupriavidus nantongensis]|uniref:TIGR02391 family protein n=1 Tax=Cupriavidus nantongensis TaxID=1796606 RepID=UPI00358E059D
MANRSGALNTILDDLAGFEIPLNPYYDDPEPQGVIDDILSGKINSLRAFLQLLGWFELVSHLEGLTPLRGNAVQALELVQSVIVPEARRLCHGTDIEPQQSRTQWFWDFVHPRIKALAKPRFEAGIYGDAVESCFKEVNDAVKRIVREAHGKELDGAKLMTTAFSPQQPLIKLSKLASDSDWGPTYLAMSGTAMEKFIASPNGAAPLAAGDSSIVILTYSWARLWYSGSQTAFRKRVTESGSPTKS